MAAATSVAMQCVFPPPAPAPECAGSGGEPGHFGQEFPLVGVKLIRSGRQNVKPVTADEFGGGVLVKGNSIPASP